MKEAITALVLGAGGNVSQGIIKALRLSPLDVRVVAACISPQAAGLYVADAARVSPLAASADFMPWLLDVCDHENVDVVLSGSEPVLDVLSARADEIYEQTGARAIVSRPEVLEIGRDKLRTAQWLDENGMNAPKTVSADDEAALDELLEKGVALIAKPRAGKGSQGILEINDDRDVTWVRGRRGYVVQEMIGAPEHEYTVACVCDGDGRLRGTFAMRRGLDAGTTVSAEVGLHAIAAEEAKRIATVLRPAGPLNVQLRVDEGRAVAFELNVRFSGTTPIRARLGFNDVDWALRHFGLGLPAEDLPEVTRGVALRYWNEIYVEPATASSLTAEGKFDEPRVQRSAIEDFGVGE